MARGLRSESGLLESGLSTMWMPRIEFKHGSLNLYPLSCLACLHMLSY